MKNVKKVWYEIDPHNQLIYSKKNAHIDMPFFRKVLTGKFTINKNNELVYIIKKSHRYATPQQIKLKGIWSLDKYHNLIYTLNKWGNQIAGNKLTLKTELIDARKERLLFLISTKESNGKMHLYILKLNGSWNVDDKNRIAFHIKRQRGKTDKLVLQGSWHVNKNNKIVYTYTKSDLKTGRKITKSIILRGYWQITKTRKITYLLGKERGSQLEFTVGIGKILSNGIRFEMGIGARPKKKIITIYGKWKLHRKKGVILEMEYNNKKRRLVVFRAVIYSENGLLKVILKDRTGNNLGFGIKLSKRIFGKQGELFLRSYLSKKEKSISIGAGFPI